MRLQPSYAPRGRADSEVLGALIMLGRAGTTSATRRQLLDMIPEVSDSTALAALKRLIDEGAVINLPVRGLRRALLYALSERSVAALGA